MKQILLTRGYYALVDDEDYAELSKYKWQAFVTPTNCYAVRKESRKLGYKAILMHVQIMGFKGIDHRDRNGLNNQRHNLRKATQSQNNANKVHPSTNEFGYKGMWRRYKNKWRVQVKKDKKVYWCGSYENPHDAAKAYNKKALELFGEFAVLNTIKEICP